MAASIEKYLSKIRSPFGGEKVYKDECVFSFDTPEHDTGLYVCMNSFLGFGKKFVEPYFQKSGNGIFLHLRRIRKKVQKSEEDPPKKKPTRMAIGVEGGFDSDQKQFEIEEENKLVVLPGWEEFPLTDPSLPAQVQVSAAAILTADSAAKQDELASLACTWDGEKRVISKHAENLLQLDNGKKIPPQGWKCEQCDLRDNLWLNLTDGSILCGRKFWDGTGGNNHAVDHYQQVKYPLAVKLGTINPDGADVYSYDEDDMVEDPHLAKHLAHWGINIHSMEKTDKTMAELEIDLNQKIGEWDVIQEAGSQLKPVYGPAYTGILNLGNSCYMNSVMQMVFTLPDFLSKYVEGARNIFENSPADPTSDFNVQMAKFGLGLSSGDYSKPPPEDDTIKVPEGIRPQMFKSLIGKGHPEFSTKRQQDAQEFLLHLIGVIERNSHNASNPTDAMKYGVEERIQCLASNKVKYTNRSDFILPLPIPLEAATNKEEVAAYEKKKAELQAEQKSIDPKELVRAKIPLSACLEAFTSAEMVDDFFSSATQTKGFASKTTKLTSFPDYLVVQLKKFTIGEDWVPKKLDVSVEVPDELDLSSLRGSGLQPGEEELPEVAAPAPAVNIDEAVLAQLMDMGFPREGCRKAVFHTNNTGVEAAMSWVMEHMGDPDFDAPLVVPGQGGSSAGFVPSEEGLEMLMAMGFTRDQCVKALKNTQNNIERAADWIFSHPEELDAPMEVDSAAPEPQRPQYRDGNSKYQLVGFISHMGTSTMVGHYVCHLLKEGRWVIFNDEKVCLSEHPPKDLAYLYLYKRL